MATENEFLDGLMNGQKVPNPAYNPKTKKGRMQPQYFTKEYDPNTPNEFSHMADVDAAMRTDFSDMPHPQEYYDRYGVEYNKINTEAELDRERADNQKWTAQLGHMVGQWVVNEVALGVLRAIPDIITGIAHAAGADWAKDFSNPVSDLIDGWQEKVRDHWEILQKDPSKSLAFTDPGWWFNSGVSIMTTASLLIPGLGVAKGLGLVAKMAKASRLSRGMAKILAKGNNILRGSEKAMQSVTDMERLSNISRLRGIGKIENSINRAAEIGTAALTSRVAENAMEARQTYQEAYDDNLEWLKGLNDEERAKLYDFNPNFIGKSNEEIADYVAGKGAAETYKNDFAMLLMDVAQFKAISALWKGVPTMGSTAALRIANRNAARQAAGLTKELEKTGFIANRKEALRYAIHNPFKALTNGVEAMELSEGIEEGFQGIQQEKGKEVARMFLDPNYTPRALESYLTDSSIWDQAFWGVLGGVAFQQGGKGLAYAKDRYQSYREHKKGKISDEEYALKLNSQEKRRFQEINGRITNVSDYVNKMNLLNQGYDPYAETTEDKETGNTIYKKLDNDDEIAARKRHATDEFVSNLTMNAVDAGNLDLLKEFITNPELNKYLQEQGINITGAEQSLDNDLIGQVNRVSDMYQDNISDFMNNVNEMPDEWLSVIAARELTRDMIRRDSVARELSETQAAISKRSDNIDVESTYRDVNNLLQLAAESGDLRKSWEEVLKMRKDGNLTNAAFKQYKKEFLSKVESLRKQTAGIAEFGNAIDDNALYSATQSIEEVKEAGTERTGEQKHKSFFDWLNNVFKGDETKEDEEEDINEEDITKALDLLDDTLLKSSESDRFKNSERPKLELQRLINRENLLKRTLDEINSSLPKTEKDYQDRYNAVKMTNDYRTKKSLDAAANIITNWLEKQNDLNQARRDLFNGNATKEVNDAAELLKLGHTSTRAYLDQIDLAIKLLTDKRNVQHVKDVATGNDGEPNPDANTKTEETTETNKNDRVLSPEEQQALNEATQNKENDNISPEINQQLINQAKEAEEQGRILVEDVLVSDKELDIAKSISVYKTFAFKSAVNLINEKENATVIFAALKSNDDIIHSDIGTNIITNIKEKLKEFDNKLSDNDCYAYASEAIESALQAFIISQQHSKKFSNDTYRKLIENAKKLARNNPNVKLEGNDNDKNSIFYAVGGILTRNDEENIRLVEGFIDSYLDNQKVKHKNGKVVIDTDALFNSLINDGTLTLEEIEIICFNLGNYLSNPKNGQDKYYFTSRMKFQNKYQKQEISKYLQDVQDKYYKNSPQIVSQTQMHISLSTNLSDTAKKILENITPEQELILRPNENSNTISIGVYDANNNFIELGYIGKVNRSNDFTKYSLKNVLKNSLIFEVEKDGNKIKCEKLDKIFDQIANDLESDKKVIVGKRTLGQLLQAFNRYYVANNNNATGFWENKPMPGKKEYEKPNKDDIANMLTKLGLIRKKGNEYYYKSNNGIFNSKNLENTNKALSFNEQRDLARSVLGALRNIWYYNIEDESVREKLQSYYNYKQDVFNNYQNTWKLQTANTAMPVSYFALSNRSLLYDNDHKANINDPKFDFNDDKYKIVFVTSDGLYIEGDKQRYANKPKFDTGRMGMLIDNVNGSLMVALFTDKNPISNNTEIHNAVHSEILTLLQQIKNKDGDINDHINSLQLLLGGNHRASSQLFSGVMVTKTDKVTHVNIEQNKKYITQLQIYPDGKICDSNGTELNDNQIQKVVDKLTANLTYNTSFAALNHQQNTRIKMRSVKGKQIQVSTENAKYYSFNKDGSFNVTIGNYKKTFKNGYKGFVLSVGAFMTNQQVVENKETGTKNFYDNNVDTSKSMTINTEVSQNPVASETVSDEVKLNNALTEITKQTVKQRNGNTKRLLQIAGFTEQEINVLTNTTLPLVPSTYGYSSKSEYGIAKFNKETGNITFLGSLTKLQNFIKNKKDLRRILIHENLHAKLQEANSMQRQGIINDLNLCYQQFSEYLANDNSEDGRRIRKWVKDSSFTPEAYLNGQSSIERFLEEFVVECLSQPAIMRYVNNIQYNVTGNEQITKSSQKKSLLQRIIDALIELFNIGNKSNIRITNSSILAREYMLLGNAELENENNQQNIQQTETEEIDEEDDGLNEVFSATTDVSELTPYEIELEAFNQNPEINPQGFSQIDNMNDFINSFPVQDRELIKSLVDQNILKYACV